MPITMLTGKIKNEENDYVFNLPENSTTINLVNQGTQTWSLRISETIVIENIEYWRIQISGRGIIQPNGDNIVVALPSYTWLVKKEGDGLAFDIQYEFLDESLAGAICQSDSNEEEVKKEDPPTSKKKWVIKPIK